MGSLLTDPMSSRLCFCNIMLAAAFLLCIVLFAGSVFVTFDYEEKVSTWEPDNSLDITKSNLCQSQCKPSGSEALPNGIVRKTSDLEMRPLWGSPHSRKRKGDVNPSKSLLAIAVGIKQKVGVNQIVSKFLSSEFTVVLFHYDGVVDEWRDLPWTVNAIHLSAINQTKWWFAKRFLHPDIVAEYDYIFLWDEDLGVENFNPERYLSIIKREGLEISQPGLGESSEIHHPITARVGKGDVHRWVEMMAPVFSRAAWRCAWHMIQNDLVHAWGLDKKLGYCAQGDRTKKVGVVDSEYIVHKGLTTLGGLNEKKVPAGSTRNEVRVAVRKQSYREQDIFSQRWQRAVAEDKCWIDPYPQKKRK